MTAFFFGGGEEVGGLGAPFFSIQEGSCAPFYEILEATLCESLEGVVGLFAVS